MKQSLENKADLIPLGVLIFSALYLLWAQITEHKGFHWKHIVGFIMLVITVVLFFKQHKLGVLSLGLTIVLGLVGILSFSPGITVIAAADGNGVRNIPFIYFQPMFILFAALHFIFSYRYYTGILSKKYWDNIKSEEL